MNMDELHVVRKNASARVYVPSLVDVLKKDRDATVAVCAMETAPTHITKIDDNKL